MENVRKSYASNLSIRCCEHFIPVTEAKGMNLPWRSYSVVPHLCELHVLYLVCRVSNTVCSF